MPPPGQPHGKMIQARPKPGGSGALAGTLPPPGRPPALAARAERHCRRLSVGGPDRKRRCRRPPPQALDASRAVRGRVNYGARLRFRTAWPSGLRRGGTGRSAFSPLAWLPRTLGLSLSGFRAIQPLASCRQGRLRFPQVFATLAWETAAVDLSRRARQGHARPSPPGDAGLSGQSVIATMAWLSGIQAMLTNFPIARRLMPSR
jgi:hypothetical protein